MNEPYKILLVDDEAEVRTSIIRKIDWSAVGGGRRGKRRGCAGKN